MCSIRSSGRKPTISIYIAVAACILLHCNHCLCFTVKSHRLLGAAASFQPTIIAMSSNYETQHQDSSALFRHALDSSRLGKRHDSLESYTASVGRGSELDKEDIPKEFSLVTILCRNEDTQSDNTKSRLSILVGKKMRGFGEGFYNCFGGKLEKDLGEQKQPAKGAVRELKEETGISIPLSTMEESFVGTINFTFDDWQENRAMRVHLFCVFVSLSADATSSTQNQNANTVNIDPDQIRGCDEIEPVWVHNCYDLPLQQMFADDSIWLPMLLHHHESSIGVHLKFDAWFHFHKGGAETNSIMHYHIQRHGQDLSNNEPKQSAKYNLEKKLFHALHDNHIHNPSIKEFKESWSFANSVRSFMKEGNRMTYVLDVAGGHGALAALFLLLVPECESATVIDPAVVKGEVGVKDAWSEYWGDKRLTYRHECLRTGLRKELDKILHNNNQNMSPTNVLVVACHACQHLTDETLEIASEYGVNIAVMPCCQKDHKGSWKGLSKRLAKSNGNKSNNSQETASLSFGTIMDLLTAGKMMAWNTGLQANVEYVVKMKLMDSAITLQNRIIMCKSMQRRDDNSNDGEREAAHLRLALAYRRAHKVDKVEKNRIQRWRIAFNESFENLLPGLVAGFCIGVACSHVMLRRK